MKQKIVTGLVMLILATLNGYSQPLFYSQSLQNLYYSLPASCRTEHPVADTVVLCTGILSGVTVPVAYGWDGYGILAHMGYRFLPGEATQNFHTAVVRFMERELLALLSTDDLPQKITNNRDNGFFVALNGNTPQQSFYRNQLPNLLQRVSGMNVSYEDRRQYRVDLNCGQGQTLTFRFVADAELLSDMDKKERDDRIAAQLSHHRARTNTLHIPSCSDATMQIHNDSAFLCKGGSFIIPQLNGNLYYTKSDGELKLAFGINWIAETLSNALLAPSERDYTMQVTQRVYGGIVHRYEVNSRDFFDYFSDEYDRFFGIETIERDILTGTLVLASKNAGHIHLAYISVSAWDLLNGGTMNIQLNANIPQHNVQTLFGGKREIIN